MIGRTLGALSITVIICASSVAQPPPPPPGPEISPGPGHSRHGARLATPPGLRDDLGSGPEMPPLADDLAQACREGNLAAVRAAVEQDATVLFMVDSAGRDMLQIVAGAGHGELTMYLLEHATQGLETEDYSGPDGEDWRPEIRMQAASRAAVAAAEGGHHSIFLRLQSMDADPSTALMLAAQTSPLAVKRLLAWNPGAWDANALAWALETAIRAGRLSIVQQLIRAGANPQPADYRDPLEAAVVAGTARVVEYLLSRGVSPTRSSSDYSLLHVAVARGHADVARLLIEAGMDVNEADEVGCTPLHAACGAVDRADLVCMLLEAGADPTTIDDQGLTPLELAVSAGSVESTTLFADHLRPADPEAADRALATARMFRACMYDDVDAVAGLVGADSRLLVQRDIEGDMPLHVAAGAGSARVAEWLLDAGAEVNALSDDGSTPLLRALRAGGFWSSALLARLSPEVMRELTADADFSQWLQSADAGQEQMGRLIEMLLERGADVNAPDDHGEVALTAAAQMLDWDLVERLLRHGASIDGLVGRSLLISAMQTPEALERLEASGVDTRALAATISAEGGLLYMLMPWDSPEALAAWLEFGIDVNARDYDGSTLLHWAARLGQAEMAQLLIEHQANVNALDNEGNTPLHGAVWEQQPDMIRLLIEHGADPLLANMEGYTPLYYAAAHRGEDITNTVLEAAGITPDETIKQALNSAALRAALLEQDTDRVRELLDANVELSGYTYSGECPYPAETTPLHIAAGSGSREVIEMLIAAGALVTATDANGSTPLHDAAGSANLEAVVALLDAGADPNAMDDYCNTSLLKAVSTESASAVVGLLIAAGANVNAHDDDSETPLHRAASNGDVATVDALLDAGADISALDSLGDTPLHNVAWAADRAGPGSDTDAVQTALRLLAGGADPSAVNASGETPLHYAADAIACDIIGLLLERGADPSARDAEGRTPLHRLAAVLEGEPEAAAARALLAAGAQINAQDSQGRTPLYLATEGYDETAVETLLALGADPHIADAHGVTPLQAAARQGQTAIARVLLAHEGPADAAVSDPLLDVAVCVASLSLDHYGPGGGTCRRLLSRRPALLQYRFPDGAGLLHLAVTAGDIGAVRALLAAGADPNARDGSGRTPLHYVDTEWTPPGFWPMAPGASPADLADDRLFSLLEAAGADLSAVDALGNTILHSITRMGPAQRIASLLARGLDPARANAAGETPLHIAAAGDNTEVARALIEAGAPVSAADGLGRTPLHAAAASAGEEVVGLLVQRGARLDARDRDGIQPIHLVATARHCRSGAIRAYVEAGADIRATDSAGNTPLHHAAQADAQEVADYLLELGAEVDARNAEGLTVLHIAAGRGNDLLVRRFLERGARVRMRDAARRTALHHAAAAGHLRVIHTLLTQTSPADARFLLHSRDEAGRTPLDCAREASHARAVELLEGAQKGDAR